MSIEIFQYFLTQGPWAILFVGGLVYTMKWTREREEKLIASIEQLLDKYDQIHKDIAALYKELTKNKQQHLLNQSLTEMLREEYTRHRNIESEILDRLEDLTKVIDELKK